MSSLKIARREFLKTASVAAALPLFAGCRDSTFAQQAERDIVAALRRNAIQERNCEWCGARDVPTNVGPRTVLAADTEKDGRIRISGTVYNNNGQALPSALIYLYHTDVRGNYGRQGEHKHGRYRGWILTDPKGKYEFETIMPASYPDSTIAAHIHMTVTTVNHKEDWIDSILFEGDRFITAREREIRKGGFDPVVKLVNNGGVRTGVRDIRVG